ncbi:MAG TPA: ABC transporter permease [Candidatus Methylacidiphilales bacterium]
MDASFLRRIGTLVLKELQLLFLDPASRRLLYMPVILQLLFFPFAVTLEVKNSRLAILNQDAGGASVELIERFSRARAFPRILFLHGEQDLQRAVTDQEASIALFFPADFSRRLAAGDSAILQAVVDGRHSNSGQIALGYVQAVVDDYMEDRLARSGRVPQSRIVVRHWFNPNLDYTYFTLPSLVAIITTVGVLSVTSLSIAREREQGTFDQLLVSPLTPAMIMTGKAVPAVIVALGQATIILAAAVLVYRVPFQGSLLLLYGSMLFYALALAGIGLLISSICRTQQQAMLGVFCFMMPSTLLSGYTSPVENMPGWLQAATWFNPLRHFIVIVKSVFLKDAGTAFVLEHLWPLAAIALGTSLAANAVFRRRIAA